MKVLTGDELGLALSAELISARCNHRLSEKGTCSLCGALYCGPAASLVWEPPLVPLVVMRERERIATKLEEFARAPYALPRFAGVQDSTIAVIADLLRRGDF